MPYDDFEFDHSNFGTAAEPVLKPTTKTGILAQMKAAGRAILAPVKRAGGKAILSAMMIAAAALGASHLAPAQSYTYTALPGPGGAASELNGINNQSQIVGIYENANGWQGFEYNLNTKQYTTISYPGALETWATGINDSGKVVGYYYLSSDPAYHYHGFIYNGGYTNADVAGANTTLIYGINNRGEYVGFYGTAAGTSNGFVFSDSVTLLPTPFGVTGGVIPYSINNLGQVSGGYINGVEGGVCGLNDWCGFVFDGTSYVTVGPSIPSNVYTIAYGINDNGQIAGSDELNSDSNPFDGFVFSGAAYSTLHITATNVYARGINNAGQVVGYGIGGTESGGFIETPTLPPVNYSKTLGSASDIPCACDPITGKSIAQAGDPITISTGNVFERVMDYSTTGENPLSFTRYYNSLSSAAYGNTFATTLGVNWRSTYDRYLHIISSNGQATGVSAERADGQVVNFTLNGSTWTPDADVDYKLTNTGTTWTLTDRNDNVETYTASGNKGTLNSIVARNGYTQMLDYTSGLLTSVTDSYDRSLGFSYYSNGTLETLTTPDNLKFTYGFTTASGSNLLNMVTYSTTPSTSITYQYTNATFPFALTGLVDENNNLYKSWTYNSNGQGFTSQLGNGTSVADLTTLTYNANGTVMVKNPFAVEDTYTFTTLQGVPKVSEISRAATSTTAAATRTFGYDTNGYLNSEADWNGNTTTYVNNAQGNPTTINEAVGSPVGRTTTISYDPTWVHEPHQIITPGLTSTFVYDGSGNPLTRTDLDTTTNTVPYSTNGQSRVTTWTWSSTGQETSIKLPRTDVAAKTTFTFTGGTLTQIQDALDHLTKITSYTGGGLPKTIVDPNNVTTTLVYDARLNLNTSTLATTAGNLVTTYTHDPANQLTAVELPDNSKLTYGYDTAHRLTSITDLLNNSTIYTLDALADKTLVQVKNPSGTVTQQHSGVFDALGRMTSDIGGMSQTTVYTYDNMANVLTITPPSPSGEITQTWDALNRLATRVDPSPGGTTTLTYDAHDTPLSVKDANGNTTAYVNDGFSERTQTTSPDSGTTVYHYDPDRNVTQKVLAGSLTANATYDAIDRPLATTYPSDSTLAVSRTYDQTGHGFGVGRLTSATDQAGSLSNTFDERGNVTAESRVVTSVGTLATATTFDAASNISSIIYPSTTLVSYTRNSMGQVTAVTAKPPGASSASTVATGITYEPFGPVTGLTFGNGITGTYGYDLDYRPTTRVDTGTSAVLNLTYGYYTNNSVHTITDAVNAANTQTLGYDTLDRITSATSGTGGYGTYGWTWDAVSNVKTQVVNGTTTTYSLASGSNKLSQWVTGSTTEVVASTAAGNINTLKIGSTTEETLTYNQANQLGSEATTSTAATYKYGLTGERLEKAVSGSNPVIYQYGQAARELLAENDLHSGQRADYIYLNGSPVGEVDPVAGKLYFTHTDRLGTPQKLTDSTKAVDWTATYNPFGNTVSFSGTLTNQSIRLPGQYFDPETAMNHNGFRDYAGSLTRYVESDPIGLAGGMNTYQYVKGNPFKNTDPKGTEWVGAGIGFVVGGISGYEAGDTLENRWKGAAIGATIGAGLGFVSPTLALRTSAYVAELTGSGVAGVTSGTVMFTGVNSLSAGAGTVGYNWWTDQPLSQGVKANMLLSGGASLLTFEAPLTAWGMLNESTLSFFSANSGVLSIAGSFTYSQWQARQSTINQLCTPK